MRTTSLLPQASISKYVSSILVIEDCNQQDNFTLPLFANGSPTLVFNSAQATSKNRNINHLTLYGQTIKPNELTIKGEFILIAYFFYPTAISSLFGIAANELTDESLELAFSRLAGTYNLQEQLLNTTRLHSRLDLLNNFIQNLVGKATGINDKTEFATRMIRHSNGQYPLPNIQKDLGITERTLQRLFEITVGVSPKMYSRICQFSTAFQQLNQSQFKKYSDIAYENGFADQSHFIRVFKEFTNLSPGAYLQKTKALAIDM